MYAASIDGKEVSLVIAIDELRLLNNALNEIANGVSISDAEFEARLGASRGEAKALLASVHSVLCAAEEMAPPRRGR
jgi:hypothetical protein